jgi:hypothetical protein
LTKYKFVLLCRCELKSRSSKRFYGFEIHIRREK